MTTDGYSCFALFFDGCAGGNHYPCRRTLAYFSAFAVQTAYRAGTRARQTAACPRQAKNFLNGKRHLFAQASRRNFIPVRENAAGVNFRPIGIDRRGFYRRQSGGLCLGDSGCAEKTASCHSISFLQQRCHRCDRAIGARQLGFCRPALPD